MGSVMQDRADGPGAVSVPWGDSRGQNDHPAPGSGAVSRADHKTL